MSDETENGVFVLHSVSGCYAEVHISEKNSVDNDGHAASKPDAAGNTPPDPFPKRHTMERGLP